MNSRERVLASINHVQPDKVPVDLGATPSSNISAIAYNNLKKHLGIEDGMTKVFDVVQQVVTVEDEIIDRFGVDVIDLSREFDKEASNWYEYTLADGSKGYYPKWFKPVYNEDKKSWDAYKNGTKLASMPEGATFFDQTIFPYENGYPENFDNLDEAMDKVLWKAFAHGPWDHAHEDNFWETLREKAVNYREKSDKAIMLTCGCNLFEWGTFLRRMDNFMMDTYIDQGNAEKLIGKLMERHMATLENVCKYVGDVVDIIRFGDDLGMDTGPFMAPEVYQKLFKPYHTELNTYVHKNSNMKTFLHSCGSIYKLMPDLIDAGYDVINPVQTTAVDMEPAKLKKEFGKDITFWGGGANTRSILNHGSPEDVRRNVLEMLEVFSPGGGFIFNQEHNIMPDVPAENIVAMYKAVKEFNKR